MATKKRVTQYQYEPPITPRHWSGDELNYAVRLSQTLDDIYNKYSALRTALKEKGEGESGGIAVETDPTVPAWAKEENPPSYTKSDVGLANVANERQYSASNPPPYPVTSVNGQTGAVTVEAGNTSDSYPVGAIYISTSKTSPASLFGGTWERIRDRFLLAAGSTYAAGKTGGAATHKLTESEMPSHYHALNQQVTSGSTTTLGIWDTYIKSSYQILDQTYQENQGVKAIAYGTGSAGGNAAHNNMPPYLTVYIWKRVS